MAAARVVDLEAEVAMLETACAAKEADIAAVHAQAAELQAKVNDARMLMLEAEHLQAASARLASLNTKFASLDVSGVLARQSGRLQESRRHADLVVRLAMAAPSAPPAREHPPKAALSSLVEPFFERRAKLDRTTHQVIGQERGTVRRFLESAGDRPTDAYGRGDVTAFLRALRQLPTAYGKSKGDAEASLAQLAARAEASGVARLSEKTVKRHTSVLSQLMQFAVDEGHLTVGQRAELVENHRFHLEAGAREQRDAWTSADLVSLFSSPVWKGCHPHFRSKPGPTIVRDAKFWLPLLALYHGARLEEFADLRRRDVVEDAGLWAVRLVESEDPEDGSRRRLKTAAAARVVPLHPEAVRLGFVTYVHEVAREPDDPLFPDIQPQGQDGKRGPRITRWFIEYRRAVGLYKAGVGMHAFRHTAITRLTDAITDEQQRRHRDFIMGHATGGSQGSTRYDKGPGLAAAAATLALLRYPELDLSHLYTEADEHNAVCERLADSPLATRGP